MSGALALLALWYAVPAAVSDTVWPTDGWLRSSPKQQGLDAAPFATLDRKIGEGSFGYVDRMLVVRNGRIVISRRYEHDYRKISRGRDPTAHQYNYSHPDWHPYYMGRDVHTLQSVTKSVTSALIGIAIRRGDIEGVEAPLLSFFEDYDLSGVDGRLYRATLDDLLTMRSGIEWHESDRPLDDTNTTIQLEASDDWIQFTLDQPVDAEPGRKWVYNSGGSHLMSGIVKKATGVHVDKYAEAHLFGPLGIREYHWKKTPKGFPDTEGGLYLEAEQVAKIGYLYLHDGIWDRRCILPEGWVEASTARHVENAGRPGRGYGYQWWRLDRDGVAVWAGLGYGGQYLLVIPQHDLIGVVNSWNIFGKPKGSILPAFLETLLGAVAD